LTAVCELCRQTDKKLENRPDPSLIRWARLGPKENTALSQCPQSLGAFPPILRIYNRATVWLCGFPLRLSQLNLKEGE
jgi:hypothetical protein